jgi:hypothetical protein
VPGLAQVGLGVVQEIAAVAVMIFGVLSLNGYLAGCSDSNIIDKAWTHIKHGIGNIFSGSLGAIPFFNWYFRDLKNINEFDGTPTERYENVQNNGNSIIAESDCRTQHAAVGHRWYVDKFMSYPGVEHIRSNNFGSSAVKNYFIFDTNMEGFPGRVNDITLHQCYSRRDYISYTIED